MLRGKSRRVPEGDDPLDAAQERRVRAVLALGGVPRTDLSDGVQQVRLRLPERAAKGDEAPRDVSAWAAVVASHLAMDWHRAKRRQERIGERLAALRQLAHPSGEETSVLSVAVAQGLDELTDQQRQVLVLRFFADLPVRDIAAELGRERPDRPGRGRGGLPLTEDDRRKEGREPARTPTPPCRQAS
ncbi:sigma-70 family RNA polymerase sigma factor [Streptomyces sp. NPDC087212]|uniref:sigma-70 family RNA polymerase sigma factor n=1 Tax=Streptomyces sp. NPDC087212 TaxID=3365766 RepID=UPI0038102AB4